MFDDCGPNKKVPKNNKNICVYIVYDVKHDGWYKARLVVERHLTDIPIDKEAM